MRNDLHKPWIQIISYLLCAPKLDFVAGPVLAFYNADGIRLRKRVLFTQSSGATRMPYGVNRTAQWVFVRKSYLHSMFSFNFDDGVDMAKSWALFKIKTDRNFSRRLEPRGLAAFFPESIRAHS